MTETRMIVCEDCGTTNRVPLEKMQAGREAVCGKCKSPLTMGKGGATEPLIITDSTFAAMVESSALPVLLDMWAPWCGPCRTVGPVIDELARELAGRVRVGKMNVDENPATSERFSIRSIPALLVLKGGREVDRIVGVQPKAEILRRLNQNMV